MFKECLKMFKAYWLWCTVPPEHRWVAPYRAICSHEASNSRLLTFSALCSTLNACHLNVSHCIAYLHKWTVYKDDHVRRLPHLHPLPGSLQFHMHMQPSASVDCTSGAWMRLATTKNVGEPTWFDHVWVGKLLYQRVLLRSWSRRATTATSRTLVPTGESAWLSSHWLGLLEATLSETKKSPTTDSFQARWGGTGTWSASLSNNKLLISSFFSFFQHKHLQYVADMRKQVLSATAGKLGHNPSLQSVPTLAGSSDAFFRMFNHVTHSKWITAPTVPWAHKTSKKRLPSNASEYACTVCVYYYYYY